MCTSGLPSDLEITDNIALQVLEGIIAKGGMYHMIVMGLSLIPVPIVPELFQQQYEDNCKWIREASKHKLVQANLV